MDFILSLIPNMLTLLSVGIEFIAKIIMGLANILVVLAITLHKLFRTKTGLSIIKIEESTKNIIAMYTNALQSQNKESNKLADIAKSDTNVIQLGKKKDDNT